MNKTRRIAQLAGIAFSCAIFSTSIFATTFKLPDPSNSILGNIKYTEAPGDFTPNVTHHYNIGQNALLVANPEIVENVSLPKTTLTIPTVYMLPPLPRKGIVINLPEMRMYYYPAGTNTVMTFPIGIGRIGKTIPLANAKITRKVVNPTWTPPDDIREFNRNQGIKLPKKMGPGPDNPLGPYAIYLTIPTYLIHSTIFPESIGRRASFGCIRMNEEDIKQFFPLVQPGTEVSIIDMPYKVAWNANRLYLEAHPPLEEKKHEEHATLDGVVKAIQAQIPSEDIVLVNWQLVAYLADNPDGIPHEVGVKVN
jgi:L,D-transpeptidase ErfK/SrfK